MLCSFYGVKMGVFATGDLEGIPITNTFCLQKRHWHLVRLSPIVVGDKNDRPGEKTRNYVRLNDLNF